MELADQKAQIARLQSLQLPESHLDLDLPSTTLLYCSASSDLKYADDKSYSLPHNNSIGHQSSLIYGHSSSLQLAYAAKETLAISKLKDNLELGNRFMATLYSYRSVARGIPQAHTQDPTQRLELYKLSYEVLKPEIQKLKDLQKYSVECTNVLSEVLKQLSVDWSGNEGLCFASTEFLLMLARSLDMILVIDSLKNAKASLNNDFSIYKRVAANAKSFMSELEDENAENHALYNFLAGQNVFMQKTKEAIGSIAGADEVLVDMVNHCANLFENQLYLTPNDKHMLLKSITFGLYLLDLPGDDHDITKKKKLRLDRLGKIIKLNPVVPFIGDMTVTLTSILFKSPRLKSMKWEADLNDENLCKVYLLSNQIETIRSEYQQYMVTIVSTMNGIKLKDHNMESMTSEDSQKVYQVLLRGVQLLSRLNCKVLEQSSWKFNNPTSHSKNPSCPENAKLYEMAVRYNYSTNERLILCEVVGYIKSLTKQLSSVKGIAMECIQSHIYIRGQMFSKTTLKDMLSHVTKKKKQITPLVQHLFSILVERPEEEIQRPSTATGTKSQKASTLSLPTVISPKPVGISSTQIHYIRVLLSMISGEKAKGMQGGFLKERDIKDSHINEIAQFLAESSFFSSMLSFAEIVNECGDLGELWFREFYLELTKEIQFPIEMSLPWILTNTSLETDFKPNSELLLTPFDIYNDAANKALHNLKSRFLYDEIEAEVNLCFDQFIWKLSQKVFSYFRIMASSILLDQQLKQNMQPSKQKASKKKQKQVSQEFFEQSLLPIITQQKRFYLLGRYININQLVGQYCNQHLRNCVDSAIARFEASELNGIIEFESLLKVTRYTHDLLSELVSLDPFENMLTECDESLSLLTNNGRIITHVVHELIADIVPNFRLDFVKQRFIRELNDDSLAASRTSVPKTIPLYFFGTKQLNSLYQNSFSPYKSYIGTEHLSSLVRILGRHQVHVLVEEMTRCLDVTLNLSINSYVKILLKGLPYSSKLPPFEFGLKGAFDYFKTILKPVIEYHELKTGVFQVFKELGNTLSFFHLIDGVLNTKALMTLTQTETIVDGKENSLLLKTLHNQGKSIDIPKGAHTFEQIGEAVSKHYSNENDASKPSRLFLTIVEKKLGSLIDNSKSEWESQDDTYDSRSLDQARSFYRLWSAILFALCLTVQRNEPKSPLKSPTTISPPDFIESKRETQFGDSMIMSGTAIIHLLKETNRFLSYDFISFVKYLHDIGTGTQVDDPLINDFLSTAAHVQFIVTETLSLLES